MLPQLFEDLPNEINVICFIGINQKVIQVYDNNNV